VRDADLKTVHLTTSNQAGAMTYTVTVSGVMDTVGTAIVKGSGDTQSWTTDSAPTVVSATYVDATHVNVLFSVPVGPTTSQRTTNYAISPKLTVTQAVRDANPTMVHLTIGTQTLAATYTVTVSGIMNTVGTAIVTGSGDTASWKASPVVGLLGLAPAAMVTAVAVPTQLGAQVAINLSSAAEVRVSIRNLAGREIAILQPVKLAAGMHSLLWNGRSSLGTKVPAGTYLMAVKATTADGSTCTTMSSLQK
ncbi:MAG: FlgD immunoglobulin-like domain containing protein, partial [Armatimonadota bacterium]